MRRMLLFIVLAVTTGCSQQEAPNGATTSSSSQGPDAAIKTVVHDFWESVRSGDANKAITLLSPVAQKCIRENEYDFVPPASNTMKFEIGEVEIVEGNQAVVDSVWTDIDGDGNPYNEQMSLALRQVNGRWCIFGMAADMGPNQPPMIMNLESPEEFFGPQQAAAAKPSAAAPRQATQPAGPQDPSLR